MREDGIRLLLEQKIDALPAMYRTVLVLCAIEKMPAQAVGEILGVSEIQIRSRLLRARRLLRKSLCPELEHAQREAFAADEDRCDRIIRHVMDRLLPNDNV